MKKKLLFTAYSMGLGGIEKALINLLKRLDYSKYNVNLILEKKEGIFLDLIPEEVKVLEYRISDSKFVLFRKIYNRLKLISWNFKLKNKFDFSCSFATSSRPGAYLALAGSSNSHLWVHLNYYVTYNYDEDAMAEFFDGLKAKNFNRVVFVSNENKRDVCEHYEGISDKAYVCNNFIDGVEILDRALEECDYKKGKEILFVNVGRHDEYQKRLSRIIEASKKLKEEKYNFKVLFIGDGPDHEMYVDEVQKAGLEDKILFLGKKKNPFPYYNIADAVILSSEYEGYPVVYLESMILNKPIVSTKVSDWEDLDKKYGMFCDTDSDSVYSNMKRFLDKGFEIKKKFDFIKYNEDIESKITSMINNK